MDYRNLHPDPQINKRHLAARIDDIQKNYQLASAATDHQEVLGFLFRYRTTIAVLALLIIIPVSMLGVSVAFDGQASVPAEEQPIPDTNELNDMLSTSAAD